MIVCVCVCVCVKFISTYNFGAPRGLFAHYMDSYLQMSEGTEIEREILRAFSSL